MSRRLSDDANLSLDNEQSLLSVKFDAQVLKKKWCGHDAHPLFVSLTAIVARGALTFLYINYFFHWYLYSRVEKQGMLVVCFVLRSERRSFIATGLNTYIYLQSTTLVFFLPQLFASGWESPQGCSHPKARSVYLLVFIQKSWNKATKVCRSFNAQTSPAWYDR